MKTGSFSLSCDDENHINLYHNCRHIITVVTRILYWDDIITTIEADAFVMKIDSIIDMSKKIGVDTLIEGVETAKQFERLYTMGCKLYQGFYFSKPVDLESFEKQWFD